MESIKKTHKILGILAFTGCLFFSAASEAYWHHGGHYRGHRGWHHGWHHGWGHHGGNYRHHHYNHWRNWR